MSAFHLAQLNIARMLGAMDSAVMADFAAGLAPMNALADASPGFVWRLQTEDGDATELRPFDDDMLIVNLSVWRDLESLRAYAYGSAHAEYLKRRREWFSRLSDAAVVLWWVPAGHQPTVNEAAERLAHLRAHGPSATAFTFKHVIAPMPVGSGVVTIAPLTEQDRAAWDVLARGYKTFYNTPTTDAEFDTAWRRLREADGVMGLGAHLDGQLVGIVHFLYHTSTWTPTVCYLQDLFTAPEVRGNGVARALIEAVAADARTRGATKCYWLTHETNATARLLYDKVARYHGFLRYDYAL
jgi:GNAT superfamily N-acetyltransferase